MTVKLYENNSLLKSCEATVTACLKKDDKFLVELDQTVFFPEGGGQLADRGKLADAIVSHVSEKDGHIYHHCDKELGIGQKVCAQLDWNVRLDRMQQHCGEHILSWACYKLFKANNVGFHMQEDMVNIDLDKELTDEELMAAELLTNEIIWDNRPIHVDYMDASEAVKLKDKMRKFNDKLTGLLRIVSVENSDVCTCCGTHPPFAGMVGIVKVLRHEKHKNGCRVEFLCGKRALLDMDQKFAALYETAKDLSVKPVEVPGAVNKLKEELANIKLAAKQKMMAVMEENLNKAYANAPLMTNGARLVVLPMEGCDGKDLKAMLAPAAELNGSVSILCAGQEPRLAYAITVAKDVNADARVFMKTANEIFHGRGGGKPDCTQGGADYTNDWTEKLNAVKDTLLK
ncbi:MAG: alanyl-tRNA editing protein [Phascolarctobacterium sp.]|nr:alanyl-tRNA editing protein [Phascolarctobacterium sp.]